MIFHFRTRSERSRCVRLCRIFVCKIRGRRVFSNPILRKCDTPPPFLAYVLKYSLWHIIISFDFKTLGLRSLLLRKARWMFIPGWIGRFFPPASGQYTHPIRTRATPTRVTLLLIGWKSRKVALVGRGGLYISLSVSVTDLTQDRG